MQYSVYILRCVDDTLYTGITNDLPRRLLDHQSGKGGKYTRAHPGLAMVYHEMAGKRGSALRREAAIKKMTRREKLLLIAASVDVSSKHLLT
ncbi:MAG: hypothetical protein A2845_01655 [Candidatus Lloydbacteria bacterium RIFCSPHIGHO2_01_FULL_49_22]|uniref:GIY-YIG domain-containing protein n=1 Tax=Candidatus Lloydbacteria bacterium RIFCSPHIGHO2_01_FULL_49_22 TaxID=1798658 RepID=A0A1G2CY11_9BACT|nr:MAG: hypothetical protein A2845_01655 [Candidatus Lloydbacteria bacterium RIFCSPHIGHO2_01_FULL_49_22]OGZ10003.1 MAG: hypothetical protein A3C14_04820 [Candidatus Lloydbacteria bacterium RIFCSPHIGHO2_02_FULL_50_18]